MLTENLNDTFTFNFNRSENFFNFKFIENLRLNLIRISLKLKQNLTFFRDRVVLIQSLCSGSHTSS